MPPTPPRAARVWRTYDGTYNDLSAPAMGAVGAAFGRNLTPVYRPDLFDEPNPIVVSRELLTASDFLPARSLNILAAAWIQFQVHDWVNHARHPLGERRTSGPAAARQNGGRTPRRAREPEMRIADNVSLGGRGPTGRSAAVRQHGLALVGRLGGLRHRRGGRAQAARRGQTAASDDGYLPAGRPGAEVTGFNESWWLGLSGLHTLFAREHNLLCDELRAALQGWSDERVYQTARLIVSALIAKIHTVEWTPAILATKAIDVGTEHQLERPAVPTTG